MNTQSPTAAPPVPGAKTPTLAPVNGGWAGYLHLLIAREKEMWREPEVIFWVFGFSTLLALGLGIAFRNKPAEVHRMAIVAGKDAARTLEMLQASPQKGLVKAEVLPESSAFNQFRLGKYDLVVIPQSSSSFEYRFDPARPESVLTR